MAMRFDSDCVRDFEQGRDQLLGQFERWLVGAGLQGEVEVGRTVDHARIALEWKWGYGDGDLASWSRIEVADFLLEWCPRKLTTVDDEWHDLPVALGEFFRFLATSGLSEGGDSLTRLLSAVDAAGPAFVGAMGDPSNFGPAKSLVSVAVAEGVDMSDPAALERWISDWNARPDEERRGLLPGMFTGPPRQPARPSLPPVALPDEESVRSSAATAPILEKFALLADHVGAGRKLTQKGHLTLADARVLVGLLQTGDSIDPTFGDRVFRTRSANELTGLRQIFVWAKKAGVLRVVHGKVVATRLGRALHEDPASFFDRSVRALLDIGPLGSVRYPDAWLAWPDVTEFLDHMAIALLSGPFVAHRPFPFADLAAAAAEAVLDTFQFRSLSDERVAKIVSRDVTDLLDSLALAGVLTRSGLDGGVQEDGRPGGLFLELTPAGVAIVHQLLLEAGYDAPVAGRFASLGAAELLRSTDRLDFPELWGELEAWRKARSPEQAATEMAEAVRQLDDPALRNLALAVLAELGTDMTGPLVRSLAEDPAIRGWAQTWLVDHGLEAAESLYDAGNIEPFVDVLAQRLVMGGPEALAGTLALVGDHNEQVVAIGRLWRLRSPATLAVLEAIGATHPVKAVAKASRKAALQHRSWTANG